MLVTYISKPYLALSKRDRLDNMLELWLAARIVIHELAHKVIGAEDMKYGWYGIKPGGLGCRLRKRFRTPTPGPTSLRTCWCATSRGLSRGLP
jgi:hypothetical protein